ncbi:MAG: hypothetical protein JWO50_210 [Candidatus Kaiserbacteria bacterium]|nr:hypothetical protein [Candidatus Kaiserbacteria bacterium]
MDENQISVLIEQVTNLVAQGREEEAKTLLANAFPQLPGDTQHEIALATFIDLMGKESAEETPIDK